MYDAFFGFAKSPFNMSPDPAFLFRSAQHEEALASLIYGVQSRKGFIVLTGEVGPEKPPCWSACAIISTPSGSPSPPCSIRASRGAILRDAGLRSGPAVQPAVQDRSPARPQRHAAGARRAGRTTVLIVDEAHNLEWEVLEEIRLLGNLENRKGKLLQIVLAGQPELDRKLEAPEYRQLKQRIALRCALRVSPDETVAYITLDGSRRRRRTRPSSPELDGGNSPAERKACPASSTRSATTCC